MVDYRVMAILRAISLEWLYGAPLALPLIALAIWYRQRLVSRTTQAAIHSWMAISGALILLLAIVDMEVMRFLGGHITPAFIKAYANPAAGWLAGNVLSADQGGRFVGPALLIGSLAVFAGWQAWGWTGAAPAVWNARRVFAAGMLVMITGGVLAFVIAFKVGNPPRRTRWRVAPVAALAIAEWRRRDHAVLSPARRADISRGVQDDWRRGASMDERERWTFPDADAPYFRVTRHDACRRGDAARLGIDCAVDVDGDGARLLADCNDLDANVHPAAPDHPGDGRDEDCSGLDASPWNVVLLILESHRGASVGHLRPWGATAGQATPALDQIAAGGLAFARASANGLPSIASFMSIHTGVEPHPSRYVATDFTRDRIPGIPGLLRDRGYATYFVSVAPPEIDNETFWGHQWYDGIAHARAQLDDRWGFGRLQRWIDDERPREQPFFATVWTGTNHVPFDGGTVTGAVPSSLALSERVPYSMRWVDEALGRFMDAARTQPWFGHTVFVITGDHGFPLGEHGSFRILDHLWGESIWVPLVFAGDHPELTPRRGLDRRVASHVDIAPTILDLVGAEPPIAFTGHSLLPAEAGDRAVVTMMTPDLAYAAGDLRLYLAQPGQDETRPDTLFDTAHDQLDRHPAAPAPERARTMRERALDRYELAQWVYGQDRLLPAGMKP